MSQRFEIPIRRHPDGAIDIAFYARRAAHLRNAARRDVLTRLADGLRRASHALRFVAAKN